MLSKSLTEVLSETLEWVIAFAEADFGNIQLVDPEGHLRIVVHHGFPDWWVDYWNTVSAGQGVCGTSIVLGERVIVEDVEQSPIFIGSPALDIQLKAGIRAVQSTPVITPSGQVVAMISTHYRKPHRPPQKIQKQLDLLAAFLATFIERTQYEVKLPLADRTYRNIVEDQTEVISRVLPDGRFTYVNEVFCRLYGSTPDQLIGQCWHPVAHPDDVAMVEAKLAELSPSNPSVSFEARNYLADGELHWMQWVSRGIFDAAGKLTEIQSVGRDITGIKQTEFALRASEERLLMALEASRLGIWDTDLTTGRVKADQRISEMLDYSIEDLSQQSFWKGLHDPRDVDRFEQDLSAHLRGDSAVFINDHRMRHKDGHWVTVQARGKVIERDNQGQPLRIIGTLLDVTHSKRLNEEGIELLTRIETLIRETSSNPPADNGDSKALETLTKRERQILVMIAGGMTTSQAQKSGFTPFTLFRSPWLQKITTGCSSGSSFCFRSAPGFSRILKADCGIRLPGSGYGTS